jgi:hypothetical protein
MPLAGKWKASVFAFAAFARVAGAADSTFAGTYALDRARSSNMAAAIDSCVSHMGVFKRVIARDLLEKDNVPSERLCILAKEDGLEISQGTDPPATCRKDGKESNWTDRGGTVYRLSCEREDSLLTLVIEGKHGKSRDEYRWTDHEAVIRLTVTVSSPHLPVPLTYLLDYRRR